MINNLYEQLKILTVVFGGPWLRVEAYHKKTDQLLSCRKNRGVLMHVDWSDSDLEEEGARGASNT